MLLYLFVLLGLQTESVNFFEYPVAATIAKEFGEVAEEGLAKYTPFGVKLLARF